MIKATIILEDGRKINLELDEKAAPITVKNFCDLANKNFYDGLIFHRVIDHFMIQGGGYYIDDMTLCDKRANTIKGEFKSNGVDNPLKHTDGVISMARTNVKDSASSQFFICVADTPHLDGEYAAFGKVSDQESLDVCHQIGKSQTVNIGYGMSDFPAEVIMIKTIKIEG